MPDGTAPANGAIAGAKILVKDVISHIPSDERELIKAVFLRFYPGYDPDSQFICDVTRWQRRKMLEIFTIGYSLVGGHHERARESTSAHTV